MLYACEYVVCVSCIVVRDAIVVDGGGMFMCVIVIVVVVCCSRAMVCTRIMV